MPLGPLRPSPLVEQATDHLREQITGGTWPVGTRLPSETALAASLGIGRSTVREALRALAGAGLVRARQGAGVFVIASEPEEDWATRLRRAAVTDVYEVRIGIEVEAARLAARRRTDDDIAALGAALAGRRAASDADDAAFVDADIALHAAVVAAAHNPVLSALFTEFVPTLRRGLIDMLELLDLRADDPDHGDHDHASLVDAVARGDGDAASSTLREELERTLARLASV
ncbi:MULTISPECIES: FadR/GntR family transcriptional regulator [unclassified Streptomyces]|uniref:FadR/GntR family transcriptional regulator n=1 Tax=unclassified Streptomyces TaxID=2593676 RepID=UPI0011C9FA65|nr:MULTISPECIES: FCD domain-containing protein [unclassified Streptomyces]WSQ76951.1 FCD domain-containing protein [Streptomyces sp. NBC_01213]TXS18495.1 FadR family transcriptional regulator [Streptomyces sp. wa22]WSQ84279.1 FCD domain-containing protein [Streptomyces sp. NBC_01212]WSR09664.1 FCD domain-containing protein [Streptomyces sp. NBC_01208]WSR47610.1 FCD domain-containing protein [Streptomyces sp. NBC_01201]